MASTQRRSIVCFLCTGLWISIFNSGAARGLEFSCPKDVDPCSASVLWLTGEIVDGDAARLAAVLKQRGPVVSLVVLADSVGGNGEEAWKIGRLLRKLRLMTAIGSAVASQAPTALKGSSPVIYYPEAGVAAHGSGVVVPSLDFRKAVCASACVDIWLGGYYRFGDAYLAVHRPVMVTNPGTPTTEPLKTLDDEVARWAAYDAEMGAPDSLLALSMQVPNSKFKLLDRSYIQHSLLGRSISDEFWMAVDCGTGFPDTLDVWKGTIGFDAIATLSRCAADHLKEQRIRAWSSLSAAADAAP